MTRRQWMWLWIWLLLFFIVFCVWLKLQSIQPQTQPRPQTQAQTATAPAAAVAPLHEKETAPPPAPTPAPPAKMDESFQIAKKGEHVTISGHFSSEEVVRKLVATLEKENKSIERGEIVIDANLSHKPWDAAFAELSEPFSRSFTEGTIRYHDATLKIEGTARRKSAKALVEISLEKLKKAGISVEEEVEVQTPKKITPPKPVDHMAQRKKMQQELDALLRTKRVTFVTGKSRLDASGKRVLDEVARILKRYPDIAIEIGGHTDSDGDAKMNLVLSRKRAQSVKRYLVQKGIQPKRLKAVGYGESRPLVKNDTPRHKQMNRRVEFKIIGEK